MMHALNDVTALVSNHALLATFKKLGAQFRQAQLMQGANTVCVTVENIEIRQYPLLSSFINAYILLARIPELALSYPLEPLNT